MHFRRRIVDRQFVGRRRYDCARASRRILWIDLGQRRILQRRSWRRASAARTSALAQTSCWIATRPRLSAQRVFFSCFLACSSNRNRCHPRRIHWDCRNWSRADSRRRGEGVGRRRLISGRRRLAELLKARRRYRVALKRRLEQIARWRVVFAPAPAPAVPLGAITRARNRPPPPPLDRVTASGRNAAKARAIPAVRLASGTAKANHRRGASRRTDCPVQRPRDGRHGPPSGAPNG